MDRKIVLISLFLILLCSIILCFSIIPSAKTCFVQETGTIYIRADGSIDPSTASISTLDNITYTLTDDINDSIVIERDNIVVDGAGCTVEGTGSGNGITLSGRTNVAIKNMTIKTFGQGIGLDSSSRNVLSGNNVTNNKYGIELSISSNNSVFYNNFVDNTYQVYTLFGSTDFWDNGYPSGGNYWSDYTGVDLYNGPYQNETGSDGIGDTPYIINAKNQDRYPLKKPYCTQNDIGITSVTTSKTVVGKGHSITVNVTTFNYGTYTATFNLTVSGNTSYISSQNITLPPGDSAEITFSWDTTDFAYGNYTLSAYAWPLPDETNTSDNLLVSGAVTVSIPGDIKGDGVVDLYDAILLSGAFNAYPGHPNWNPNADIIEDNVIDLYDALILSGHFNEHYP